MLPSRVVTALAEAISRAQSYLLSRQAADGHWVGELEADTTITAEFLLLGHLIDRVNRDQERRAVRYLRRRQCADGGWNLFEAGPSDLSATIKAYFAMKMAGVPVDDPAMVAARERVHAMGGPTKANVFTKIQLALFGEYDWNGVPTMPAEIMLLPPPFFLFNIYEVSYWSRCVIVPLLIIMDRKPITWLPPHLSLDELWPVPREQASLRFSRVPEPFTWRGLFWKSFFIAVDDGLKIWERFSPRPIRKRAIEAARLWLEERMAVPGGLGGIYPAMANSILALRTLGYPEDHPLVRNQIKEIEALAVDTGDELHYQPCPSPVWDTCLAVNALIESGLPADHAALGRAAEWMLKEQILVPGDWQVKRPHVQPGGWAFQYGNDFYPDLDDTAVVLMALEKVMGVDPDRVRLAKERGLGWVLGMQNADGGWASFDADNDRLYLNNIPFADHGALLDPSTEDLTGRGLELLGTLGYTTDFEPAQRALHFIRHTQRHDGPWYGRWGVNYVYGTWSVLRGLAAIGVDSRHEFVQRAVRWLQKQQNADGGWGETCESYARPELAGIGPSIPSQTAWALLGLFAAGATSGPSVERGIAYLMAAQRTDGSWDDPLWNGTGFPRVFYLKYHLYASYFPLWALGVYRRAHA
ncbi:MAG TPA: squalene--hopene cyclase [Methylomirabilota bacterium]|jgi:squalene-hopene/tetraprenyl-beta-curcumene cyclase|nr:squalene--hopene cyclase [Methylomirabilota bacterium]